jgi:hypothetical protein
MKALVEELRQALRLWLGEQKADADAPPGEGGRFKALVNKLKSDKGKKKVDDPKALAAFIGRKKYGKAKFAKMAAAGK